jgi:hypothetical protein
VKAKTASHVALTNAIMEFIPKIASHVTSVQAQQTVKHRSKNFVSNMWMVMNATRNSINVSFRTFIIFESFN